MFHLKKKGINLIFIPVLFICVILLFSCSAKDKAAAPNESVVNGVDENVNMEMEESLLAVKCLEKVRYDGCPPKVFKR